MEKQDKEKQNKENQNIEKQGNSRKTQMNSKRIVALTGASLLALLYIVTLVVAITDNSEAGRWFMTCIFATVAVPMLIWIYTWLYGKFTGHHTIADPTPPEQPEE